jgi:hypothetical protein
MGTPVHFRCSTGLVARPVAPGTSAPTQAPARNTQGGGSNAEDEIEQWRQEAFQDDRDRTSETAKGVRQSHPDEEVAEAETQSPEGDDYRGRGHAAHEATDQQLILNS